MSCLDIFFSNWLPIRGSMDICLKMPESVETKHSIFMMGNIKDVFKNFGISQLFSKSIIIVETRRVIALANFLRTEKGRG